MWLRQIFSGMCMGVADLIPGISGGTIAFIMGFYEELMHSIKNIRKAWDFLLATLIGMAISIVSLAHVIKVLLTHDDYRIYLYSFFLGLILASIVFIAKQIKKWDLGTIVALLFGAAIAYIFCDGNQNAAAAAVYTPGWIDPWIIMCGMIGISAMLLPGISGSYMLNILGMYPVVIAALAEFVTSARQLQFNLDAFLILGNLGAGIILGALLFSRVISWLLDHYHQVTLAWLTGFLIGSLKVVWPQAETTSSYWWIMAVVAGFVLVFMLEKLAERTNKQSSSM